MRPRVLKHALLLIACGAHAHSAAALNAEDEARALIGMEHAPVVAFAGRLAEHLSCIDHGGGFLAERGRLNKDWMWGLANCQGRFVMLLEQVLGSKAHEERPRRIVDAYLLPEVVGIDFDPQRPAGPYLTQECYLDNRWDTDFYAVVRLSERKRMDWRSGVLGAWGYDVKHKRIVPLSTKRVVCHKPEPD